MGEAIGQWRSHRGLSQEALAAAAGLTRQTIYAYEAGRRQPTVARALLIAQAVGAGSVDALLAGPSPAVSEPAVPYRAGDADAPRPVHAVRLPLYDGVPAGAIQRDMTKSPYGQGRGKRARRYTRAQRSASGRRGPEA